MSADCTSEWKQSPHRRLSAASDAPSTSSITATGSVWEKPSHCFTWCQVSAALRPGGNGGVGLRGTMGRRRRWWGPGSKPGQTGASIEEDPPQGLKGWGAVRGVGGWSQVLDKKEALLTECFVDRPLDWLLGHGVGKKNYYQPVSHSIASAASFLCQARERLEQTAKSLGSPLAPPPYSLSAGGMTLATINQSHSLATVNQR